MKKWIVWIVVVVIAAGAGVWWLHRQSVQHEVAHERNLVALGDSATAGDGLHATPAHDPAACQRSDLTYPVLVAKDLKLQLRQLACSNAKVTTGLLRPQDIAGGQQPAQVAAARPYLRDSDVVMTVGVNDVGGLYLLARCAQQAGCLATDQAATYQGALPQLGTNLDQALATIKAGQPRRIVVNTYYHLLEKSDTCYAQFGLTADKVTTIYSLQDQLNAVLRASAQKAGARIVNIDFSGHGLCANEPWIQGLIAKSPLHPTEAGQRRIAKQDEAALR